MHGGLQAAQPARFAGCAPLQQALVLAVASNAKLFFRGTRGMAGGLGPPAIARRSRRFTTRCPSSKALGILARRELRGQYESEGDQLGNGVDREARDQATPRRRT